MSSISPVTDGPVVDQDALPICPEPGCGQSFESHRGLASHMKKHAAPVECPNCHRLVRYLAPHLAEHERDDDGAIALKSVADLVDEVRRLRKENSRLRGENVAET